MSDFRLKKTCILYFTSDMGISLKAAMCLLQTSMACSDDTYLQFLHPKELIYYNTLRFPQKRKNYLLGRLCVKEAIKRLYPNIKHTHVNIFNGILSHPVVSLPLLSNLQVSISHSFNMGFSIVFPEQIPMGIDTEKIDNRHCDILSNLTTKEEEKIKDRLSLDKKTFYTLIWSSKESLSKVLKTGLTIPMELYKIKDIHYDSNYYIINYHIFNQYKTVAFILYGYIFAITFPQKAYLISDIFSLISRTE